MGDEYTAFGVFFMGMVVQAILVVRSFKRAAGALGIAFASLAVAWLGTREEEDQAFSLLLMATLLFLLVFAGFYKELILPRVSAMLLLHYTLLGVYALYAYWDAGPMPLWLLGWFALPVLTAVYLVAVPRSGKLPKLLGYVWFLLFLSFLMGRQISLERLRGIQNEQGFGLELHSYVFFAGMVFLHLGSNAFYLVLLIPSSGRRARFTSVLVDPNSGDAADHADLLASRVGHERFTPLAISILVVHALALWVNWRFGILAPGVVLNAVAAALAFDAVGTVRWS